MYLWKIEYNCFTSSSPRWALWIALNYVSLKDWIQLLYLFFSEVSVVNCFKLCIFERLNTTSSRKWIKRIWLWIALNYVSLKDWIQPFLLAEKDQLVVNCFKLCIFERLNTTQLVCIINQDLLWIALNYVSLKDWIQH